jgi:AI-2 transport protein TqsA
VAREPGHGADLSRPIRALSDVQVLDVDAAGVLVWALAQLRRVVGSRTAGPGPPRVRAATLAGMTGQTGAAGRVGASRAGGDQPAAVLPRGLVVVLGTAGAVIAVAGMRGLAWMLGPVFLALMLVVAVSPVQSAMRSRRLPGWLSTVTVLLILYAVIVGLVATLVVSLARFATVLPQYTERAQDLLTSITDLLARYNVGQDEINKIVDQIDLGKVAGVVSSVLSSLSSVGTTLFFLLALLFFMGLDAAGFGERVVAVSLVRPGVGHALRTFAQGTRRYLVVSSIFGLVCAVLDAGVLAWLGVPLPILWGLLSFITNYIPNVGFVIGLVPPALLALLDGGLQKFALVVLAYSVINVVIQTIIQPKFVGDVVGLSTTVTFLATAFWAWVLGPLGALLAIPLTLLTKALLVDVDPGSRWLNLLIGSDASGRGPYDPVDEPVDEQTDEGLADGSGEGLGDAVGGVATVDAAGARPAGHPVTVTAEGAPATGANP